MPELPEVTTTVNGLNRKITGLKINSVWEDWAKTFSEITPSRFSKKVVGAKVKNVTRRAKYILINLDTGQTIAIHMKMTGHLLYGKYSFDKKTNRFIPPKGPLEDPFNRFIHTVFTFSNGFSVAFCDTRKFGKIILIDTKNLPHHKRFAHLGPEPLEKNFDIKNFKTRLLTKPRSKIKTTLMDQSVISGIGNIYSDEMLFLSNIAPESQVEKIPTKNLSLLFKAMKAVLSKGIDFGGDSMSDYRNIFGEKGRFQETHRAYRKTNTICSKKSCGGTITRKVVGGRSAHFCNKHQTLFT